MREREREREREGGGNPFRKIVGELVRRDISLVRSIVLW
jgi:hypothetical protein